MNWLLYAAAERTKQIVALLLTQQISSWSPNTVLTDKAIIVVQSCEQLETEVYGLYSFCGIFPKLTG